MLALDLGELTCCKGDAVVVSKEVVPEGEAAARSAPEAYSKSNTYILELKNFKDSMDSIH